MPKQKWKSGNGFAQIDDERSISYRPDDPFRDPLLGYTDSGFKYVVFPGLLHDNSEATDRLWAEARQLIARASQVIFLGYSLPCYDTRSRAELRGACAGKKITVIDPCEQVLAMYRGVLGESVEGQVETFEDCTL